MKARDLIRKNLRRLRTERGVSARYIARLLDVETTHIYRIEKGITALSPEYMDKICAEYNVDPKYFLTDHDKSTEEDPFSGIPPEIFYELMKVKDLSPAERKSVIDFIKFQVNKMNSRDGDKRIK